MLVTRTSSVMKPLTVPSCTDQPRVAFRMTDSGLVTLSGRRRERRLYDIDINRWSLTRHIPNKEHSIDSYDTVNLAYLGYLYTLRLADTKMIRRLTKVHKDVVTETKDNIFKSGDILQYKIATMRCAIDQLTPSNTYKIEKHFVACGLTSDDAILYHLLYHNHDLERFLDLLQEITDLVFTLDVDTLRNEIFTHKKALSEFNKQANYFAYRKLKFIASGNRFDVTDMKQDLLERGIQSYYWVRPFYSVEHAINYAKRSMHGYMNVLIAYYNHEDRRRLSEDTGFGSDNVLRSFDDNEEGFASTFSTEEDAMISYLDYKRSVGVAA